MAIIGDADRAVVHQDLEAELSSRTESIGSGVNQITKGDMRAAVNAADQWVSDNKASFNNALPTAAKNGLTTSQKAELLVFVVRKRFELGL